MTKNHAKSIPIPQTSQEPRPEGTGLGMMVSTQVLTRLSLNNRLLGLPVSGYKNVWKHYQYRRRQLHKFQYEPGGIRRREGGSNSLNRLKKGDIVLYRNRLARVGGYMNDKISLHTADLKNKRFTQRADPKECIRLYHQKIMYVALLPTR
ncbi:MAG: hypothetical protein ACFFCD_13470 [Promethearchaeota archaeon]